jgi:hypothetical protein
MTLPAMKDSDDGKRSNGRLFMSFLLPALTTSIICLVTATAQPAVRISEFMAANKSIVIPNAPGVFDDWIELHNPDATAVDLTGWFLTDNAGNLTKWPFPPGTTLPAGEYRVILANNGNGPDANGNLQTNFALAAAGEYLALIRPDLSVATEFGPEGSNYPPQSDDISYGLNPSDLTLVYFSTPTPGAPNSTNGFVVVSDLQFSHERGYFTSPISVALATTTAGATVYYTLDGSSPLNANGTPAANATAYSSPIPVATTTMLRAAGSKSFAGSTAVATHTYIFPQHVATQTRPPNYPLTWGGGVTGDYDVDPQVSQSAADTQRFQEGLRDLPTISVVASRDTLFGTGGLYVNSLSNNEKAVSAEYFHPSPTIDGETGPVRFQIDCGIRMQGGASRNAVHKKHSVSLRFRSTYGKSKLIADLFKSPATNEFNSIQLRAMYNNSWIHGSADQRARATMIADQWIRDSHIAMGNDDGGSGRYVHLFLNGMYWGVYNLHERPENDHYAGYSGGAYDKDQVFGFNPGNNTFAERDSFNSMKAAVATRNWNSIISKLDVDSYIDFYIGQHFGHNDDLKTNDNWRAAGGGPANAPWRFYPWDSERTLENPNNANALAISQDGASIIADLIHVEEFRVRFADRAYKHLHHDGALTNPANRNRYLARVAELDRAIVGESARWGDKQNGGGGPFGDYTRAENWLKAVYGPLSFQPTAGALGSGGWFPTSGPNRTTIMINAWKSQTWASGLPTKLPAINPPQFAVNGTLQHGGSLPNGAALTLTGGTGEIYYTTDGSDPRIVGGAVQPGLAPYTGTPLSLDASGPVKVRWKLGDSWSALNEAHFSLGSPAQPGDLRIAELHYHPTSPSALERVALKGLDTSRVFTRDDFQFLEILNVSAKIVNLSGCELSEGVAFTFGDVSLLPGQRAVVAERLSAFAIRYPDAPQPAGQWSGALAKNGETVTLLSASLAPIDSVTYGDSGAWPSRPDGDGPSLEIINPLGMANDPSNWRSSREFHGTPGSAGAGPDKRILINEILANTTSPLKDALELVNTSSAPLDLSGWFLSDGKSEYRKFRIPNGTILAAGAHLAFDETHFNHAIESAISDYSANGSETTVTSASHGLSTGDAISISGYGGTGAYNGTWQVIVTSPHAFTIPVACIDNAPTKGGWTPGQPFALSAQGETVWLMEARTGGELVGFVDQVSFPPTLEGESVGRWPDAQGPLVPLQFPTFGTTNSPPRVGPLLIAEIMFQPPWLPESDFEFVEIWNPTAAAQSLANWTLRGNVDFNFTNESIPAGGRLVVVGFDPADTVKREAFLTAYRVDHPVAFTGPWNPGDSLSNAGGTVRLRRAGTLPSDESGNYPLVVEDEVNFLSSTPWPDAATGNSLNRVGKESFGSEAASWAADIPTPGGAPLIGFALWAYQNEIAGDILGDPDGDGLPNLVEYAFAFDPLIADFGALPQPALENGLMVMEYHVDQARQDVSITVEGSEDLAGWEPVPSLTIEVQNGIETRRAKSPPDSGRYFMRFRVTSVE